MQVEAVAQSNAPLVGALTILAHDMRGPLASLRLLVEAMGSAASGPEAVTRRARKADRLIQSLDGMLGSILERARRSGDPLACVPGEVDLVSLVEEVAALNLPAAERRNVRLHCLSIEPLVIEADAQLIRQAVDNLLSNAIKHTRRGGLVRIEAGLLNGEAIVRVTDEGPGLTDADLRRAFRPFTTLSARADDGAPANGVGLYIVRLIAERHGGRIEAGRNRSGRGSVFTLRLPLA